MPVFRSPAGRVLFLHLPKTGGTTVRASWPKDLWEPDGDVHRQCEEYNGDFAFTFTVIRHPLAWLESYFRFRYADGWHLVQGKPWPLDGCRAPTFAGFVGNYLARNPGGYGRLVNLYTRGCGLVLRTESLDAGLAEVGRRVGLMPTTPNHRLREGDRRIVCEWEASQQGKVLKAESCMLKRFYSGEE